MSVIKESTNDSTNLFNLDGKDYAKGKYIIVYDSVETDGSGNIDFDKIRVGIVNKAKQSENLVIPKLVTGWNNGTVDYSDFDTLITDLSTLFN